MVSSAHSVVGEAPQDDVIDARLRRITAQPFRARFHLGPRERAVVELRGMNTVAEHARDLIRKRVAPAHPHNDGKQTPYRGHPVFVAQHATGTCCRTCLERNHDITAGHDLTDAELDYVVEVLCRWISRDYHADR